MIASDPPARPRSRPMAPVLGAVVITVLAWASAFIVVRSVRAPFAPGALAFGRLLVGTLALSGAVALRGGWVAPTRREWVLVAVCGVAWFGIYNVALNAAERRLDPGTRRCSSDPDRRSRRWAACRRRRSRRWRARSAPSCACRSRASWSPASGTRPPALALLGGLLALCGVAVTRRAPPTG